LNINHLRVYAFMNRANSQKNIFNQIAKKGLLAHTKQRILMKYEKPKLNTALRRSRRGINPSPANPHSRTHGFVDAHPALRAH
jgi:hypothetical protein